MRRKRFKLDEKALAEGRLTSTRALVAPSYLSPTPWMKNLIERFDKIDANRVSITAPVLKAEEWIENETRKLLQKYCGEETMQYDDTWPVSSELYYNVDCWRNFKPGTGLRHVDASKLPRRIKDIFQPFSKKWSNPDYTKEFPEFASFAAELLIKQLPKVKANTKLTEVSAPFQNKDSNVGYPFFKNDRRKDEKGVTYGQKCMALAESGSISLEEASYFPYVGFTRFLRGKVRPIIGSSRVFNILANRITAPMIQQYKKSSFFSGYLDPEGLKNRMVKLGEIVLKKNKNVDPKSDHYILVENRDYSQYDTTIAPYLRLWCLAINQLIIANDRVSQDCIKLATFAALDNQIILPQTPESVYGRILSGELLTNLDGSKINALITLTTLKQINPNNEKLIRELVTGSDNGYYFMGDDNLTTFYRKGSEAFTTISNKLFSVIVHPDKGEKGLYFLQRRVMKRDNHNWIMVTPFTRIIRSLIYRERSTALGTAGWILMAWSLLYQLIEYPELLKDVARIFMPLDKYRLGADLSINQLIQLLKQEDKLAAQKDSRFKSSSDRLNDGDPLKEAILKEIDHGDKNGYLAKIHRLLCSIK